MGLGLVYRKEFIVLASTIIVLRAVKFRKAWGNKNARAFVENQGVDVRLYRLACQLDAMKNWEK